MLLTFYFTKTSMIDIFDLKYRFVPTQTQTTFCCSVTQSCLALSTPRTAACQASLSFTISWSFLKLMSIESVMPSNHLTLCHLLPLLPSILPSIRVFSNESALRIRWPNVQSVRGTFFGFELLAPGFADAHGATATADKALG